MQRQSLKAMAHVRGLVVLEPSRAASLFAGLQRHGSHQLKRKFFTSHSQLCALRLTSNRPPLAGGAVPAGVGTGTGTGTGTEVGARPSCQVRCYVRNGSVPKLSWASNSNLRSPSQNTSLVPLHKQTVRNHGGHGHSHAGGDGDHEQAIFVTWLGLGKNLVLCVSKGVVGVMCSSSALVADAAHSLFDMVSDLVALATLRVSRLPPDSKHPYGHGKYESIGALCVSGMLVGAGGGLVWHAVELVTTGHMHIPTAPALWISVAAIALNEALFHITLRAGKQANSATVIANAWHHRADAASSVVAMAGIGAAMVGFPMADPIAGGLVGLMIAKTGAEMVLESVHDLTDGSEEEFIESVTAVVASVPGVASCQAVRHRRMGPHHIVDATIAVHHDLSVSAASQVADRVRHAVKKDLPQVTEMLIHVSPGLEAEAKKDLHEQHRSHEDIDRDVRQVLGTIEEIKGIGHVSVYFVNGTIQVRCEIIVDDDLRVFQANRIARWTRKAVEQQVEDVTHVDVHLELDDNCWGECGRAFGPACASGEKMMRRERLRKGLLQNVQQKEDNVTLIQSAGRGEKSLRKRLDEHKAEHDHAHAHTHTH